MIILKQGTFINGFQNYRGNSVYEFLGPQLWGYIDGSRAVYRVGLNYSTNLSK